MLRTRNDEDIEDTVEMGQMATEVTVGNEVMMRIVSEWFGVDWNTVG